MKNNDMLNHDFKFTIELIREEIEAIPHKAKDIFKMKLTLEEKEKIWLDAGHTFRFKTRGKNKGQKVYIITHHQNNREIICMKRYNYPFKAGDWPNVYGILYDYQDYIHYLFTNEDNKVSIGHNNTLGKTEEETVMYGLCYLYSFNEIDITIYKNMPKDIYEKIVSEYEGLKLIVAAWTKLVSEAGYNIVPLSGDEFNEYHFKKKTAKELGVTN